MINVTSPLLPEFEEYCNEIASIWENRYLTNGGEKHNALERALAEYLGVDNIILFSNGHTALSMLLKALDIKGEVITSPYTFASTTHAIVENGLDPVFCDIETDFFTLDAKKIEGLITKNTSLILPIHVYGNVANVKAIDRIGKEHGIPVVYDAAHAFGIKYKGEGIGAFGYASIFSFHATKVFNTIEGGAVATKDKSLASKLRKLRNFGLFEKGLDAEFVSGNGKLNEFSAAMGLCNLRHIEKEIEKRKRVFNFYCNLLSNLNRIFGNK